MAMFAIFELSIFFLFLRAAAAISEPDDFSPCYNREENYNVICNQISLEEVQRVFNQTSSPTLEAVKLTLKPYISSETFIPEDIFGKKQIRDIEIGYPLRTFVNRSLSLQVDADAFRSTKNYTKTFIIYYVDCTLLDLGFLSGFDELTSLTFFGLNNIQHCLPRLPPLPKFTSLNFTLCTGMNHLNIFPTLSNGLKVVIFFGHLIDDIDKSYNEETVDRIVDWLILSSANTLEQMTIEYMNQVTRVPHKIPSFKALTSISMYRNNISTIKSGAFSFSAPVSYLDLAFNGLKEIESGAFQGDFKDAVVSLYNNSLTRFEESVFGPTLQQMASGNGFIEGAYDAGNPIDCSDESICHLTWLKNYEVDVKFWLKCSNGTSFKDLQPAGFNHCS